MTRRRAKRLYTEALASYIKGYAQGAQDAAYERRHKDRRIPRLGMAYYRDSPAYAAGYDAGREGEQVDDRRLPLGVWARVLAKALEP